jgi:crossover junction endodeoxyribonuclease RusA
VHPPDRRRRDLDNILKALLDALQYGGAYQDDSQIDSLQVVRSKSVPGGKVMVLVSERES